MFYSKRSHKIRINGLMGGIYEIESICYMDLHRLGSERESSWENERDPRYIWMICDPVECFVDLDDLIKCFVDIEDP